MFIALTIDVCVTTYICVRWGGGGGERTSEQLRTVINIRDA